MSQDKPVDGQRLHQWDSSLHESPPVQHVTWYLRRSGSRIPNDPPAKLNAFLAFLAASVDDGVLTGNKVSVERQVEANVIGSSDVPESYFDLQRRILREEGHGLVRFTRRDRERAIITLQEDQRTGLQTWLDYLTAGDQYPHWFRFYVWESVKSLGPYSPEKGVFPRRSRGTAARYPELNAEALAMVYEKLAPGTNPSWNFGKLYSAALQECGSMSEELRAQTRGEWIRYERSENPEHAAALARSLQPWGTGWCTAGEATAHAQLKRGDFWVYCTPDESGANIVPRLAIRMESAKVAEVRGVAPSQEVESQLLDALKEKLSELPGGERYQRVAENMKRVTGLDRRLADNPQQSLSSTDLRFLYEVDGAVDGFGFAADPRLRNMRNPRDVKADLAVAFDTDPSRISRTKREALAGGIVCHWGNLRLSDLTSLEGVSLPKNVLGYLDLDGLTSAVGLEFADHFSGSIYLDGLTSAEHLRLPSRMNGALHLSNMRSAQGLELPDEVGGDLALGVSSAKGLRLPARIGGFLHLSGLTSAQALAIPAGFSGNLYLDGLTSARGLKLPMHISSLSMKNLQSATGLELPAYLDGELDLKSLTSAEDLTLPIHVGWSLNLGSLTSAEGLTLPQYVGSILFLGSLKSAEGLRLPESVNSVDLSGLESAEGLKMPSQISGNIDLESLTSPRGLALPDEVGGSVNLGALNTAQGLALPRRVGGALKLGGLTSSHGLVLPDRVEGDLDLSGLTSIEGLTLPSYVGGKLNLNGLQSADGLVMPKRVVGDIDLGNVTSAKGLTLPRSMPGTLDLSSVASADGLLLPGRVAGDLLLHGLTSAIGLKLPHRVGGFLDLGGLTSVDGLNLPKRVDGPLSLSGLTSAKGLRLPDYVGEELELDGLVSAEGLTPPKFLGGQLWASKTVKEQLRAQLRSGKALG